MKTTIFPHLGIGFDSFPVVGYICGDPRYFYVVFTHEISHEIMSSTVYGVTSHLYIYIYVYGKL